MSNDLYDFLSSTLEDSADGVENKDERNESNNRSLSPLPAHESVFGFCDTRTREVLTKLTRAKLMLERHCYPNSRECSAERLAIIAETPAIVEQIMAESDRKQLFSDLVHEYEDRWLEKLLTPYELFILYHESIFYVGQWLKDICDKHFPFELFESVKLSQWHWCTDTNLETTLDKIDKLAKIDNKSIDGFRLHVLYTPGSNNRGYTVNAPLGEREFVDADLGILISQNGKPVVITGFFFGSDGGVYLNQLQGATRNVKRINRLGSDWRSTVVRWFEELFHDDIYLCDGDKAVQCYDNSHGNKAVAEIRNRIRKTYERDITGYVRVQAKKKGYTLLKKESDAVCAA